MLTISENKKQLIGILVESIKADAVHKLIITGQAEVPTEMSPGNIVIERNDLKTTHEEADPIVVAQAMYVEKVEGKSVSVVADDTDIYALLLHHYFYLDLHVPMIMESPKKERSCIDIPATVDKNKDIIPDLLAAHAATGCDVCMHYGIGKDKMLSTLRSGKCHMILLGDLKADRGAVVAQATAFMCSCYGHKNCTSMTQARIIAWTNKTGRRTKTPKLCSLPPTTEAFELNVMRGYYQCAIWKQALEAPPDVDPTDYGWVRDEETKSLKPVHLPASRQPAPSYVLKLVCCSCVSQKSCLTKVCGCNAAKLTCTVFCKCEAGAQCHNEETKNTQDESDEGEQSED